MARHLQQHQLDQIDAALRAQRERDPSAPLTDVARQLAAALGLGVRTIYDRARAIGIEGVRGRRSGAGALEQAIAELLDQGRADLRAIATDLNCSLSHVRRIERRYRMRTPPTGEQKNAGHRKKKIASRGEGS